MPGELSFEALRKALRECQKNMHSNTLTRDEKLQAKELYFDLRECQLDKTARIPATYWNNAEGKKPEEPEELRPHGKGTPASWDELVEEFDLALTL